ncbi:hypothetical protein ALC56_00113 [Trachymyrmex septentrionalis]|uniref:Uncharacterized protein n=1 Tax=Trachymyrmex septentrionalis TaxID=34720 RepID=A0A195G055_9HYME|nr:hypothetical protein ALC56_00113 [Trachymyrmex septentrionalis]
MEETYPEDDQDTYTCTRAKVGVKRTRRRRRRWWSVKLDGGTHTPGKSKGEQVRRRKRVRAEEGERCKGCVCVRERERERERERQPSAEGCDFRFSARSAFFNLCPRMLLVMPIRDAFESR